MPTTDISVQYEAPSERVFAVEALRLLGALVFDIEPALQRLANPNEQAKTLLGSALDPRGEAPLDRIVYSEDRDALLSYLRYRSSMGSADGTIDFRVTGGEGGWVWLRGAFSKISQKETHVYRGVFLDVTAQKEADRSLRDATRRKDQFLAVLAHELRNPLAALSSGIRLLQVKRSEEERARMLGMLEQELESLSRLVNDLLDVSRIARGKTRLCMSELDLRDVLIRVTEGVGDLFAQRKQQFLCDLGAEVLSVTGDSLRLGQIFANLLGNASKFTPVGGRVALRAREEGSSISIIVEDSGIGIPPDKLSEVFELFSQLDTSSQPSQFGLGIGLALVKSLTELHGGSVRVESGGVGRGSTFLIRLPKAMRYAESIPRSKPLHDPSPLAQQRLLIVEDNRNVALATAQVLSERGYSVQTVFDGHAALEAIEAWRPDAVLLDLGLPGLDGYQVARHIRTELEGEQPLIIALSGYSQLQDRVLSRASGCDYHIEKPVNYERLFRLLQLPTRPVSTSFDTDSGLSDARA